MKFDATFKDFLVKEIKAGLSPMLMGEPGIGKSSLIHSLATTFRTKVFVLTCNQLADRADLTGARLIPTGQKDPNGNDTYAQVFFPHATIMDCIQYANDHPKETPILFLDEINRTSSDITSAILSFTTDRKIGTVEFPSNVRFILAGNDKGNVTSLDEASISRFSVYHCEPDVNTFMSVNDNLNPFIQETLKKHPECILCKQVVAASNSDDDDDDDDTTEDLFEVDTDFTQFTTPRTLTYLSNWMNLFDNNEMMTRLGDGSLKEGIEAHIGDTLFTAYLLETISSNIMSTNNQANTITAVKPAEYDQLKACTDMQSLHDTISNMDDNSKSGCILYALYEQEDNTVIIKALAENIENLIPTDLTTLTKLSMSNNLDTNNVDALLQSNTRLSQGLAVIFEMMS